MTGNLPSHLFVFQHAIWQWDPQYSLNIYGYFKIQSIIEQCMKYIDNNKSQSASVPLRFRTDGTINAQLCDRFVFVLRQAAFRAQEYENANPHTSHGATLILVVIWEIFSDMRFVFYVLWKSKIKKKRNGERPALIKEMLRRGYRAVYIAYHLCYVLVCKFMLYILFFFSTQFIFAKYRSYTFSHK